MLLIAESLKKIKFKRNNSEKKNCALIKSIFIQMNPNFKRKLSEKYKKKIWMIVRTWIKSYSKRNLSSSWEPIFLCCFGLSISPPLPISQSEDTNYPKQLEIRLVLWVYDWCKQLSKAMNTRTRRLEIADKRDLRFLTYF